MGRKVGVCVQLLCIRSHTTNSGKGFWGISMRSVSWAAEAACKGGKGSLFYAESENDERKAKAICSLCSVRVQCLEFAIASREPDGIWGGLNPRQRRRLVRERQVASVSILVGSR